MLRESHVFILASYLEPRTRPLQQLTRSRHSREQLPFAKQLSYSRIPYKFVTCREVLEMFLQVVPKASAWTACGFGGSLRQGLQVRELLGLLIFFP